MSDPSTVAPAGPSRRNVLVRAILWVVVIVAVVGILIAAWWWLGAVLPPSRVEQEALTAAEFGDQFGAVGALFGALALAAIVVALILQTLELSAQRAELEQARVLLGRQNHEVTLFNLLRFHREESERFVLHPGDEFREVRGHRAFKDLVHRLIELAGKDFYDRDMGERREGLSTAESAAAYIAKRCRHEAEQQLDEFLATTRQLLTFVDATPEEYPKATYQGLTQAQFTQDQRATAILGCWEDPSLFGLIEGAGILPAISAERPMLTLLVETAETRYQRSLSRRNAVPPDRLRPLS